MTRHRSISLGSLAVVAVLIPLLANSSWAQPKPKPKPAPTGPRTITGTVQQAESGTPIEGVTVKVKGSDLTATTAADGTFSIPNTPAGEATLELSGPNHVTKELVVAAATTQVAVTLSPMAASSQERVVTGIVKDEATGGPVVGAVVSIRGTEIRGTTDEDGLFVLTNVPAADFEVDVEAEGRKATGSLAAATSTLKLTLAGGGAEPGGETPPAGPTRAIAGKITETTSKEPVAGATITVQGTDLAAITEADGTFVLDGVSADAATLEISGPNHEVVELVLAPGRREVNLEVTPIVGETIVITGRAPVLMKQNLANGASVVNDRDLNRVSSQTLDTALTGKVSGANIQNNSGAPGGGTQLRLRGISTINGQSSPLYVVDGVIMSNVAVPSGANAVTAAAAGGSASNQDNPVNRIADLNPNDIENVEILKGASAAALYGSKAANGVVIITTKRGAAGAARVNVTQRVGFSQISNKIGSRTFDSQQEVMDAYGDPALASMWTGTTYDHEAEMTQTPLASETIASASGGTENGSYAGSVLIRDEPGVVKGTFYEKQSGRLAVGYNFGDKLSLTLASNLIHSLTDRGLTNNDNTGTSLYVALSSTPNFLDLRQRSDGTFPINPLSSSNPLQTVTLLQNEEDVWRLIGSSSAVYKLYKDEQNALNLQGTFGVDRFQQVNGLFSPPELQFEDDDGLNGTSIEATTQNLNYNVGLGGVWAFTPRSGGWRSALSGGFTYESVDLTSIYVIAANLNAGQPTIDTATSINTTETRLRTRDQGVYLQEEVALLEDRLTLLAGLLGERSSLNGDTAKYYLFPKAAVMYKLPVAEDIFDPLRVRAAYGEAGNRPLYGQKFTALLGTNTIDGSPGLVIQGNAGDIEIEPERQREFEIGLDAALHEQRAVLELTAYHRGISNLLLQKALPTSTGFITQFENGGSMWNRGIEAALAVMPVVKPVEWTTRAILTLNRSQVTDLPGEPFNVATVGFGAGLGAFRIEEGKSATQIVSDVDGDGMLDVIGNGEPDFRVGWSNEVKVGDWGLFTLLDWQQGSEIVNLTRLLYDFGQVSPDYDDPGPSGGLTQGEYRLAKFSQGDIRKYVERATFAKLREVSVFYNVPEQWAKQIGPLSTLRFSLSGRNLLTFTGYSGLDPEVSNFGNQPIGRNYDVAPYPPSRSFWFSVDAGF
jgi:TonB-linked SusC/RagA family outer membrane protein